MTIDEIRERAQKQFPLDVLDGIKSVVCFYGATSGGRSDLIHLFDAGLSSVHVVDVEKKLRDVATVFPENWEYTPKEPEEILSTLLAQDVMYDLVICDGSAGIVDYVWEDLLPRLFHLSRKRVLVRLSGEYAFDYVADITAESVRVLARKVSSITVNVEHLARRSSGRRGTWWVAFSAGEKHPEAIPSVGLDNVPAVFDEIEQHRELCVLVKDLWGEQGCCAGVSCAKQVNHFRQVCVDKDRHSLHRVYTPARFARLPTSKVESLRLTAACFDLNRFSSVEEFHDAARVITSKRGTVNRKVKRAKRLGYYVKPFHSRLYVPDIHAIHFSLEERGGKPLRDSYRKSIEEMGGYPDRMWNVQEPECPVHHDIFWGVFKKEDGYKQGEIVTNERLVVYIHFHRYGNHGWYSWIMGHGDYLSHGVMYLLHFSIIEYLIAEGGKTKLRFVCYGAWNSGPKSGTLRDWKRKNLFEPRYLIYEDAGNWRGSEGMNWRSHEVSGVTVTKVGNP